MGGVIDMMHLGEAFYNRELLIAMRNGEFMGHIFVSWGVAPLYNAGVPIRGLHPYGIARSPFYLPGSCTLPSNTSGYVQEMFNTINRIAQEHGVTHIFTY